MRLLNTSTLQVKEFFDCEVPVYAILSHTWGNQEVTLQDIQTTNAEEKAGYSKIRNCCAQAAKDGYEYVWIDTCCIDKTSSAELSEAINSMYAWYKNAHVCYAYLADVPYLHSVKDPCQKGIFDVRGIFRGSKWFSRGWTLQELIAPSVVEFYAEDWTEIGTKSSLRKYLSLITGIDIHVLDGDDPSICNVAERMSWAASRQTTRVEDTAYSLLGIFHVYMPLIYGEGKRAFLRLQEEILKGTDDYTLLAWGSWGAYRESNVGLSIDTEPKRSIGPLATDVFDFKVPNHSTWRYSKLEIDRSRESMPSTVSRIIAASPPMMTARGLHISLPIFQTSSTEFLAYLYCKQNETDELLCMSLGPLLHDPGCYERQYTGNCGYHLLSASQLPCFRTVTVYIQQTTQHDIDVQTRRLIPYSIGGMDCIFRADANALGDRCTVIGNWGAHSNSVPWISRIHTNELLSSLLYTRSDSISFEALFALKTGDRFLVKFGLFTWKLWCRIFLDRESPLNAINALDRIDLTRKGHWEFYKNFVPEVLTDRDTKVLPSNLAEVSVVIRRCAAQVSVEVSIN